MIDNPYEPPRQRAASDPPITDEQEKGQWIVVVHILLILMIALFGNLMITFQIGTRPLLGQVVRFALNVAFCWWIYRGSVLAVRLGIGMFALSGVVIAMVIVRGRSYLGAFLVAFLTADAAVDFSFAFVLLASPSVYAFYNYQYLRRQQRETGTAN